MFIALDCPCFEALGDEFFEAMYYEYRRCGLWDITEDNTDFVGAYYAA